MYEKVSEKTKSASCKTKRFGAGSRGRTDTVLLPSDFESDASANSTIPANGDRNVLKTVNAIIISHQSKKINS